MKVLAIVQAWNSADSIRGFIVRWMEELSDRVDQLIVLTLEQEEPPSRPNIRVFSLDKGQLPRLGRRWRYLFRWHRLMPQLLSDYHPDVIFTHMSPILSVLAAPYARPRRIPIVTWYAHRQVTTILRVAHHWSDKMVASAGTSYRYKHDKLVVVGQGVDTDFFSPDGTRVEGRLLLLSVARLSPIKDPLTLIGAVDRLCGRGHPLCCAFVGDAPERDRAYARMVRERARHLELDGTIQFVGAVPNAQVVSWYRRSFAHINLCPTGALDKAVLEAMACGKPSFVANEGFQDTLGRWADALLFRHGDVDDLASKIEGLLVMEEAKRQQMSVELRQSVVNRHSLEGLADRLIVLFQEVQRQ